MFFRCVPLGKTRSLYPSKNNGVHGGIRARFSLDLSVAPFVLWFAEHARWAPFIPIDPSETTVLDVMIILGYYGAHRVWMVDSPGGDITGVISQVCDNASDLRSIQSLIVTRGAMIFFLFAEWSSVD